MIVLHFPDRVRPLAGYAVVDWFPFSSLGVACVLFFVWPALRRVSLSLFITQLLISHNFNWPPPFFNMFNDNFTTPTFFLKKVLFGSDGVACLVPSHYPSQRWLIDNWAIRSKLYWNFDQNVNIFTLHKLHFKMLSAQWRSFCLRHSSEWINWVWYFFSRYKNVCISRWSHLW